MHITEKSLLAIVTLASATLASAQSAYTGGHGDIGIAFEGGAFEPHWHLGAGATVDGSPLASEGEYEPGDIFAETSFTRMSPSGLNAGLGVADGTEVYVLGSASYPPNLGFAAEELDPSDWIGDITLTLSGWTTPLGGELAIYSTNLAGSTVSDIAFSTYDVGATFSSNSISLTPGDHGHFEWAMTIVGNYDLEFTWEGTHVTEGFQSATQTFSASAVPEPATTALLLAASVAGLTIFQRRRRA